VGPSGSAQNTPDPTEHRTVGRCQRERAWSRERCQLRERTDVHQPITTQLNRDVVAAVFARFADLCGYPPDRRVIKEQRLDDRLQQVD
jgi:hypothetical protein